MRPPPRPRSLTACPHSPHCRAPEDTFTVYPDWHRQASTPALLADTGHAWRLPPALIPVLPAGNANDTSADLVIDAGGYPAPASPNTRAAERQPAFAGALSSSALCGHLLTGPRWPGQVIAPGPEDSRETHKEIDGEDPAGLCGQELLPGRGPTGAARDRSRQHAGSATPWRRRT